MYKHLNFDPNFKENTMSVILPYARSAVLGATAGAAVAATLSSVVVVPAAVLAVTACAIAIFKSMCKQDGSSFYQLSGNAFSTALKALVGSTISGIGTGVFIGPIVKIMLQTL